ncbi:nicotinamide riboside kinase [Lichtheimia corymbifera JMRC:FSU:9682]|uniref:Nicotinamide riboside kinase n=1 Tax=Lichtheimia corymbifera JMRC:FSU:9682 TaxID=1263082 RepID=A0A068S5Q9_9FUNG|nr:nicotinamide riboside kinase [Lichtheimia corymbifera JMRC:FSU:9682]
MERDIILTLTRILQKALKHTAVIYQDDFFKSDSDIPMDPKTKLQNWDCPNALDFDKLNECVHYAIEHCKLPEGFVSKEEENKHDGSTQVSKHVLEGLSKLATALEDTLFLIVDGFMLYWDQELYQQFDCKIFITASYTTLKTRRESRQGYVTTEGYWADPPGYFDAIVWPEYVRWNQHLFQGTNHSEIEHEAVEDVLVLNTDDLSIDQVADAAVQRLLDKV